MKQPGAKVDILNAMDLERVGWEVFDEYRVYSLYLLLSGSNYSKSFSGVIKPRL